MAMAAAKAVTSFVRPGAAATATRAVARRLVSTGGEILDEDRFVKKSGLAMPYQKLDIQQLLHEQNLKINRLQRENEVTKEELEIVRSTIECKVIEGQIKTLKYLALLGFGLAAIFKFT